MSAAQLAAALRGRHLHIDCASGAAGDMLLGALIDLGVPVDVVGDALDAIGAGRSRLRVTRVVKYGIAAVDIKVDTHGELVGARRHVHALGDTERNDHDGDHGHGDHGHGDHGHGDHAHYHYTAIRQRLVAAPLAEGTRRRALDAFDRIARAEAKDRKSVV